MRPIILGMNNPISTRPEHALYPLPDGCTGNRLWRMLSARTHATMREYLNAFERRNLVVGRQWDQLAARARAHELVCELRDSGRTVVLLGSAVREALDYALKNNVTRALESAVGDLGVPVHADGGLPALLVHPQVVAGVAWRQVPHPSGLNRWYNTPKNVEVVELLMEELYDQYKGSK